MIKNTLLALTCYFFIYPAFTQSMIQKEAEVFSKYKPGEIFEPYSYFSDEEWGKLSMYFKSDERNLFRKHLIDKIYGGEKLSVIVDLFSFEKLDSLTEHGIEKISEPSFFVKDYKNRIVDIYVNNPLPHSNPIIIQDMNFNQLLVESSLKNSSGKGWGNIDYQSRLEICQNELARWSLMIKSDVKEKQWNYGRIHPKLSLLNAENIDKIEIINNCTTSKGFELKLKIGKTTYHGSFSMPQNIYRQLCIQQAGAWARQGWGQEKDHSLIDGKKIFFGNSLYFSKNHLNKHITIDFSRYRKLIKSRRPKVYDIDVQQGIINYSRWGDNEEYYVKPKVRNLVMSKDATNNNPKEFQEPPTTYSKVQQSVPNFKLPNFTESGLYNIFNPQTKDSYAQLKKLTLLEVHRIESKSGEELVELILQNEAVHDHELYQLIIGNINLNQIPVYPEYFTIDRFGYNPRKTSSLYDPTWIPASERSNYDPIYAFMTARTKKTKNIFIQPEGWGLERIILSYNDNAKKELVIDLISFERILPVYQGIVELN